MLTRIAIVTLLLACAVSTSLAGNSAWRWTADRRVTCKLRPEVAARKKLDPDMKIYWGLDSVCSPGPTLGLPASEPAQNQARPLVAKSSAAPIGRQAIQLECSKEADERQLHGLARWSFRADCKARLGL